MRAGRKWPAVAILALALLTRLVALGDRALHHDESIHAVTALDRLQIFVHHYDPVYHGPFLYFANALAFALLGDSDFTARLLPAAAGIALLLAIPWLLRDFLGRHGTALAVLIFALSPAFLYYSRFLRNDIYIALFTLLAMGSLLRYLERPQCRWIVLAAAAFGIGLATKENTYISGFIFVSFLLVLGVVVAAVRSRARSQSAADWSAAVATAAGRLFGDRVGLIWGLAILVGAPALFFSSFLLNPDGLLDSIRRSVAVWAQIHASERVNQPWFFYLGLVALLEPAATCLGLAGIVRTVRSPDVFGGLLVWWVALSFLIYSAAGEKAAWLVLHPLLPLGLLAARCGGDWIAASGGWRRTLAVAAVGLLLLLSARHAFATTFLYGEEPRTPLVYTQTSRDVLETLDIIATAGTASGLGGHLPVLVDSTAHWPMAWYLRDHPGAIFGNGPDHVDSSRYPVMILDPLTVADSRSQLGDHVQNRVRLRQWFPEHVYQSWRFEDIGRLLTDPSGLNRLWSQWAWHDPPGPIGSTNVHLFVAVDLAGIPARPAPVQTPAHG